MSAGSRITSRSPSSADRRKSHTRSPSARAPSLHSESTVKPSARSAFARRTSGRAAKGAPGRPSKDQAGSGDSVDDRTGREGEDGAETDDRFEGVVGHGAESGIGDGFEGEAGTESAVGSGSGGGAGEGPGAGAGTQGQGRDRAGRVKEDQGPVGARPGGGLEDWMCERESLTQRFPRSDDGVKCGSHSERPRPGKWRSWQ